MILLVFAYLYTGQRGYRFEVVLRGGNASPWTGLAKSRTGELVQVQMFHVAYSNKDYARIEKLLHAHQTDFVHFLKFD